CAYADRDRGCEKFIPVPLYRFYTEFTIANNLNEF
ncbi:hypothetical protein MGSAQ_002012, partial [marine sediment metagenome]